jgi:hypothetical protein
MKKTSLIAFTFLAFSLALAVGWQSSARADGDGPLAQWMEANLQTPMEAGDLAKLAVGLEKAAAFAPDPTWNQGDTGWEKLAKAGAAKAKAGDLAGARAACKSCHTAWRKKYKAQFRDRPLPH